MSLILITYHAIKTYGNGGIAPPNKLDTTWKCVVTILRPLYTQRKSPPPYLLQRELGGLWKRQRREKSLTLREIEPQSSCS